MLFLQKNGFLSVLIKGFMKFSAQLPKRSLQFLLNLLSAFVEVLQEDEAILKFTGNNVFERMLQLVLQLHEAGTEFGDF